MVSSGWNGRTWQFFRPFRCTKFFTQGHFSPSPTNKNLIFFWLASMAAASSILSISWLSPIFPEYKTVKNPCCPNPLARGLFFFFIGFINSGSAQGLITQTDPKVVLPESNFFSKFSAIISPIVNTHSAPSQLFYWPTATISPAGFFQKQRPN